MWHLDGGDFGRPRGSVLLLLRTPAVAATGARGAVLTQIATELLSDHLATPLAACGHAGVGWSVGTHPGGLMLSASGYSQRLPRLSADLACALAAFVPDGARFELVREALQRSLRNRAQERPLSQATYALTHALTTPSSHHEEALAFVGSDGCTAAALAEHVALLLRTNFVECLVHGNLAPSTAAELGRTWRATLGGAPMAADGAPLPTARLVPAAGAADGPADASLSLRGVAANVDESNSAIEAHYQLALEPSVHEEALMLALSQVASKDAFGRLRTDKQLGYVVQCGVRSVGRARGLSVLIQSAVMAPADLDAEIEGWLAGFRAGVLAELTQPSLDEYKEAIAASLDEPPKTLSQEASILWSEIVEGTHQWRHEIELAAAVRALTVGELCELFDDRIAVGAPRRRKVASHFWSQADDAAAAGAAAAASASKL